VARRQLKDAAMAMKAVIAGPSWHFF